VIKSVSTLLLIIHTRIGVINQE